MANANAEGAEDLTALSLEQLLNIEVVSASKFSQKAIDAPSSITLITAEDIRTFGYRTLADVLKSVRGFSMTSDRVYGYVGVRGFSPPGDYNDRLLVMIDGYRINDNIFDQGFVDSAFMLDLDLVDRIEIVRGPSSSVYGSNALFGVVNVITRRGAALGGVEASARLGNYRTTQGRVSWGGRLANDADVLLSLSTTDERGGTLDFPDFAGIGSSTGKTRGTDYEHGEKFFGRWALADWTVEVGAFRRRKGNPASINAGGFDDPRSAFVDEALFLDLKYAHSCGHDGEISGRLYVGGNDYTGDFILGPLLSPPDRYRDVTHGRWWGGEAKWVTRPTDADQLVVGLDYQKNLRQDQVTYALGPFAPVLDSRESGLRYGIYAQNEHRFSDAWALTGGLRYDRSTGQDGEVSPRLAAVYKPTDASTWKFLYGTAFRSPNVYETSYHFLPQRIDNPNLRPERIRTWELAFDHFFGPDLHLTTTAYHYLLHDQISQVDVGGVLQYQNVADVRGRGVEVELEKRWEDDARLRGSLSRQEARDFDGQWAINAPRLLGKLNYSRPLPGNWRLGAEAQYVSMRRTNLGEVGGYGIANLTLLRPMGASGWEWAVTLRNLFNRSARDPVGDDNLGLPGLVRSTVPQDGRTADVKVTFRF